MLVILRVSSAQSALFAVSEMVRKFHIVGDNKVAEGTIASGHNPYHVGEPLFHLVSMVLPSVLLSVHQRVE